MKRIHMERIKRFRRVLLSLLLLVSTGVFSSPDLNRLHRLNKDIVLLNLINGLFLTEAQTRSLIEKIDEAETVRENFNQAMEQEEKAIYRILNDLKKILLQGEEIPEDLKKRIHEMKRIQHELEDRRGERLQTLERDVEALLTPNQKIVLETYKPCTIPPAEGNIGQSVETAAEGLARLLTHVRRMPGYVYRTTKEMIIDGHLDRVERIAGLMDAESRASWRQRIDSSLEQARVLSDQEFLVQKGEMAKRLMPEDLIIKHPRRKNQLGRTGHFFFDPGLADLLRSKLKI